ncbi:MAG: glycyl-radical enzyme activating protein [Terracidiphilus sp.]|jgi:pyruvate formate lyase activating enzyme
MNHGLIFNIQRFSLQDGPGLRSTVFMKGCPLSCLWCHNPESWMPQAEFVRMENRCMACGLCSEEELAGRGIRVLTDMDLEACPTGALQKAGHEMELAALVKLLLKDRIFFDESGGGVTFSGGEPLLQMPFLIETLELLRTEGVHTALDTCGYAPWNDLQEAARRSSLVLYDLKLMDDDRHQAATGRSNRIILDNLKALSGMPTEIRIRVPVIPGINDDDGNMEAAARFVSSLARVRRVDLLPYHRIGEPKFARMGITYTLAGLQAPTPQRLESLAAIFRGSGLVTTIGGRP